MFGPPGRAYVYLSYGIHSLLNFVCEPEGDAAAVLIRALEPTRGLDAIRERRPAARTDLDLCSGPGKLTEALGVTLAENAARLDRDPFLLLPPEGDPPAVVTSPRVGITKAVERPWRFSAAGSPYVSRPGPASPSGPGAAAARRRPGEAGARRLAPGEAGARSPGRLGGDPGRLWPPPKRPGREVCIGRRDGSRRVF